MHIKDLIHTLKETTAEIHDFFGNRLPDSEEKNYQRIAIGSEAPWFLTADRCYYRQHDTGWKGMELVRFIRKEGYVLLVLYLKPQPTAFYLLVEEINEVKDKAEQLLAIQASSTY